MWNKKTNDGAPAPYTPPTPATSASPAPVAAPVPQAETRPCATIGKAVRIIGEVYSEQDLYIDGEVQGSLQVKGSKVTIGPNGKAKSDVQAAEVVIAGQVQGDVEALRKITIRKDGSLVGNIRTAGIVIEDDAYFKGSIDIVRNSGDGGAK